MRHLGVPIWQFCVALLIGLILFFYQYESALIVFLLSVCTVLLHKISKKEKIIDALVNKKSEAEKPSPEEILKTVRANLKKVKIEHAAERKSLEAKLRNFEAQLEVVNAKLKTAENRCKNDRF